MPQWRIARHLTMRSRRFARARKSGLPDLRDLEVPISGKPEIGALARPGHESEAARAIPDAPHAASASSIRNSRCQTAQSSSFPRRDYAPGFVCLVRPGLARGFGVEAAVTLAAIPAAAIPLHPDRGVDGAPTGALFLFVARARRDHPVPGATGTSLSALHRGGFRPGTRAAISGSGTPEPAATCPRQVIRPGGRGPGPPAARFAPPPRDATPRSACRIVSGRRPS